MRSPRFLDLIGDAVNPIVVKELKQALQSRFVIAVLLLFLLGQMVAVGIYLMVKSLDGSLDAADFQGGQAVFSLLHWILLATCMLFIPVYSGFRLAAERSEVHVDLLFIGALSPRAILAGKVVAALILALIIFSACTPFMTFTYFLRGIDLPTIFIIIGLDFLMVAAMVMLALFLAIVPANRMFKVLLGVLGLFFGLAVFGMMLGSTTTLLESGLLAAMEGPEFWTGALAFFLVTLGGILFLFVCSVGLLSPLSANRTLPLRIGVTFYLLCMIVPLAGCANWIGEDWPIRTWLWSASILLSLGLLIAVNEREKWGPRVARTIPRRWWLRPIAFLFFSGAAGGVLWASLSCAGYWLVLPLLKAGLLPSVPRTEAVENVQISLRVTTALFAYTYCYALTAVFLRNVLFKIQPVYTWVLALALAALGSVLPYLLVFLIHYRDWSLSTHSSWLLTNPGVGMRLAGDPQLGGEWAVIAYLSCWAAVVTVLNGQWFIRQMRRFRPVAAGPGKGGEAVLAQLSAGSMETTRTLP
jgi:hypothetical protein